MTIFDEPEEYCIATHWLAALFNDDPSGLTDDEEEQLTQWESEVRKGRDGHFATLSHEDEGGGEDFTRCDISGLFAMCEQIAFLPIKGVNNEA